MLFINFIFQNKHQLCFSSHGTYFIEKEWGKRKKSYEMLFIHPGLHLLALNHNFILLCCSLFIFALQRSPDYEAKSFFFKNEFPTKLCEWKKGGLFNLIHKKKWRGSYFYKCASILKDFSYSLVYFKNNNFLIINMFYVMLREYSFNVNKNIFPANKQRWWK